MARGQMSKLRAKAGGNEGDMNPKQLKEQAAKLRKLTPSAIRRTFPQMKDMSDAMIAAQIDQMEKMADDPELRQQVMEQRDMMDPADLRRIQKISQKKPDQLTADELSFQFKYQAKLLANNPEQALKQLRQNPQYASLTDEDIIRDVNNMAEMDPETLYNLFSMRDTFGPMAVFWQKMDVATNGMARYVVLTILVLFVYWIMRRVFFFFRPAV